MKKIRLYVFGYRDQSFWCEYGPIVRDLMIVSALCELDAVDSVEFYNRPVTLPELLLRRKKIGYPDVGSKKITFISKLSYDIFGPLRKRLWVNGAYKNHYNVQPEFSTDYINVVLDFLPIGELPEWVSKADVYWYDLIDNFTKHNRFTDSEKNLVKSKYYSISAMANAIKTGVSMKAVCGISGAMPLPNAILSIPPAVASTQEFDFGFMGFVTNKFNVDVVRELCMSGYKVAIFGDVYDSSVRKELMSIENAFVFGGFKSSEVSEILARFKVGLIPYINSLLHDESPLKLYQYLSVSKPVLSSFDFEFSHEMFFVYDADNLIKKAAQTLLSFERGDSVKKEEMKSFFWDFRIKDTVDEIFKHAS